MFTCSTSSTWKYLYFDGQLILSAFMTCWWIYPSLLIQISTPFCLWMNAIFSCLLLADNEETRHIGSIVLAPADIPEKYWVSEKHTQFPLFSLFQGSHVFFFSDSFPQRWMWKIVETSSLWKIKIVVSKYHILFGQVRCIKICFIDANALHIEKRVLFGI